VDLDGAPCTTPGTTGDCPDAQACGNDRRCSARALACRASRCAPGVGDACLDPSGAGSGTALARWCSDSDPVCGAWTVDPCAARGTVCGRGSGAARCECPQSPTRELTVSPDGGAADAPPYASGATSPPGCTFRTLTAALLHAGDLHDLDPASPVTVVAAGAPAGGTRIFSAASGESFPLLLRDGVVLTSDGPARGGTYEIRYDRPAAGETAVSLAGAGSGLHGFTIRNGDGGAESSGVHLGCAGGTVRLSSLVVEGRGDGGVRLGTGISGWGCAAVAEGVQVREVGGAGIDWGADLASSTLRLALTNGSVRGSGGAGVVLRGGRLLLDGVRVAESGGRGVDATSAGAARVEIRRSSVVWNHDTGIAIRDASDVRISRTTVYANLAATSWGGALVSSGTRRRAGGVVISGTPPAPGLFELWGNRVYGNGGDQILVLGPSSATWNLDQPAGECSDATGLLVNAVGCYDPTLAPGEFTYRGIVSVDAAVTATGTWWEGGTPLQVRDVVQLPGAATVPVDPPCATTPAPLACGSENPP
jgi:hypothetical protein